MNPIYKWTRFWAPRGVSTQEFDFLPDPEGFLGNPALATFDKIQDIPCLILLGNPGIGKSGAVQQIAEDLRNRGLLSILKDFKAFGSFQSFIQDLEDERAYQTWLTDSSTAILHLFLDSLDEGLLEMKRLEHDLQ